MFHPPVFRQQPYHVLQAEACRGISHLAVSYCLEGNELIKRSTTCMKRFSVGGAYFCSHECHRCAGSSGVLVRGPGGVGWMCTSIGCLLEAGDTFFAKSA